MEASTVSVVIPTHRRAELLERALASCWAQTRPAHEVVVVVSAPDPATDELLTRSAHPRLKVVRPETPVLGGDARNLGVAAATGHWIAFLDDDDWWEPRKLELQLAAAATVTRRCAVVASGAWLHDGDRLVRAPRRQRLPGEAIADYIFVRRSWFRFEGYVNTSMLLARRQTLLETPFTAGLANHQDYDWMLRVAAHPDFDFVQVDEPLVHVIFGRGRSSVSNTRRLEASIAWARSVRHYFTPKAIAAFLLVDASRVATPKAMTTLFVESFRLGRPRLKDIVLWIALRLPIKPARALLRRLMQGADA